MNNQIVFFILFGLLCSLAGYFAFRTYSLVLSIIEVKRRRRELPYLEMARQELLCKGPHSYDRMRLAMAPLPIETYLICKDCGFISNDEGSFKLNKPALEVYHNNLKIRDRQAEIDLMLLRKKQEKLDLLMNKMIKGLLEDPDFYRHDDINFRIQVLQQFFRKSAIEIESMYASLKKDLDEAERGG